MPPKPRQRGFWPPTAHQVAGNKGEPLAEREWLRPEMPAEAAGTAWTGKTQAAAQSGFELRPLSLGEVLDRTFALYRSRFWLFAGISMIAAAVNTVGQAVSLAAAHKLAGRAVIGTTASLPVALANIRAIGTAQAGTYAVFLIFFLVAAITQAATALAVTEVYLGRPTTVEQSLGRVAPRWYRWIGIALWQAACFLGVPFAAMIPAVLLAVFGARSNSVGLVAIGGVLFALAVFAGFPVGAILYLRNSLAIPAAVSEGLTIRPAMRRSKVLAAGTKGRLFVVLFIAFCLLEIVAVLQSPVALLMVMAPNKEHYLARAISLLITFVGHTVVAPIALIGLTLVYFDQRVRKEAFDLELLLEGARTPGTTGVGTAASAGPEGYAPLR